MRTIKIDLKKLAAQYGLELDSADIVEADNHLTLELTGESVGGGSR